MIASMEDVGSFVASVVSHETYWEYVGARG